ncbi:MAG: uncharacterized protein QOH09_2879 [Pseudonocardiales bacterium]|jgi:uncharacterized protein|nr:hypothetical protein [Pseudonocardiales bacterium]MDT7716887.1 uncharacterized protein [Pseudonocardiales bacterium]
MTKAMDARPIGAVAVSARSLAPDLARGAMLLLIALANACLYQYGKLALGDGLWLRGNPIVDQVLLLVETIFVRDRAYPMYALLFGYGIVQMLHRHSGRGIDEITVCRLVRRRGWWMVLIGFCHALLLFCGDIIGAYGLIAVLLAEVLLRARDRTLLITSALWVVPIALFRGFEHRLSPLHVTAAATPDPLYAAAIRVAQWVQGSIIGSMFMLVPAVLLGVWAARRRILDDPERHQYFLRRAAVLGIGLAAIGGVPWGLVRATWWTPSSEAVELLAGGAHTFSGYAGGVGYAAIAGLVAVRMQNRDRLGPVVSALAACGQRSMTCYLLQSVVFVAVLAAYGGGLGNRLGLAEIALVAALTWAMTVLLAEAMSRRGYRGPAEVLLRRLTYRPSGASHEAGHVRGAALASRSRSAAGWVRPRR